MANPPFDPTESLPSNTGVVSIFPQQERSFRDIIESWLLWEHDRSGYHAFDMDTTVNRDADSTRPAGSIFYNTTLNVLQFCVDADPSYIWDTISFPPGTRLLFNNTDAPIGWTKVEDAAYNDALVRIVTGTPVAPSGALGMSAVFTDDFDAGETGGTALEIAHLPTHEHFITNTNSTTSSASPTASGFISRTGGGSSDAARYSLVGGGGTPDRGRTSSIGSDQEHTHPIELDINVKRVEFILCEKDAFA